MQWQHHKARRWGSNPPLSDHVNGDPPPQPPGTWGSGHHSVSHMGILRGLNELLHLETAQESSGTQ